MSKQKRPSWIDEKALSRKYCLNATRVIRAWREGRSDLEIALMFGTTPRQLMRMRQEIQEAHQQARCRKNKTT
ncbi:hypothetical protein SY88_01315 [Clostridiales bacterium PH28_bin88]|nr:hypothetical protein SY88_01315 [Clostridiales bacterium PH28_bin88]